MKITMRKLLEIGIIIALLLMMYSICRADNSYLQFDGSTGYVSVLSNAALDFGTDDFSFCFWVKLDTITTQQYIFHRVLGADPVPYSCLIDIDFINNVSVLECCLSSPGNSWLYQNVLTNDRVGKWLLITIVKTSAGVQFYLNSVAVAMIGNNTGNPSLTFSAITYLGAYYDTIEFYSFFSGSLDDFRIYKSALSQADVTYLYNGGMGRKYVVGQLSVEPSATWDMDEGTGTTITDAVGGTLYGTFTGGVRWVSGGVPLKGYDRHRDRYKGNYRSRYQ